MHLQENTLCEVKVTQIVVQYPNYAPEKFEVFRRRCIYKKISYVKVTQNVTCAQSSIFFLPIFSYAYMYIIKIKIIKR